MPSGQYKRSKEELNRLRAMAPLGAKALKSWHKFVKLNPEHPKVLKAIIARNKAHRNNWNKEKYRIRQLAAMHKPEVVARRSKKLKRILIYQSTGNHVLNESGSSGKTLKFVPLCKWALNVSGKIENTKKSMF